LSAARLPGMKPEAMLETLEQAAAKLSIRVSYESLGSSVGTGGLCRVKGQYRVIIERRLPARERLATLADALSTLDTSSVHLPPSVRELIDFYAVRRAS